MGQVKVVCNEVKAINAVIAELARGGGADACLFWDPSLELPKPDTVQELLALPGDVWHAGLKLGTAGLPVSLDFVHPTWMLNCDPKPDIGATSWRISIRACLVRLEVLRKMGGLQIGFDSLRAAELEWGHRLIKQGVFVRHAPALLPNSVAEAPGKLSAHDELLFLRYRFTTFWYAWSVFRFLVSGVFKRFDVLGGVLRARIQPRVADDRIYRAERSQAFKGELDVESRISVILPTVNRYPYLEKLLEQLRTQTFPAHEIIVIDQTPLEERDSELQEKFRDLPLVWIMRNEPGQCSARNDGLQKAEGDLILFLDDDVEIPDDYIQCHLTTLAEYRADSSSGVVFEPGEPRIDGPKIIRISDVFPAGNTLIRRDCLEKSGLFDLAYDRGRRADGDLGMRVMKSGALMVLNPNIEILHHRAPAGGLRKHGQRTVTRSSSRMSLTKTNLPGQFDIYLAKRHFSPRQVREMLWIATVSTLSCDGSLLKKSLRLIFGSLRIPFVLLGLRRSVIQAKGIFLGFPKIGSLEKLSN